MLSWGPPAGRHAGGTQNVKPEARTWCHTESGVPTPGMAQGATGAICDERPPDAAPTATNARYGRVSRIGVPVTPAAKRIPPDMRGTVRGRKWVQHQRRGRSRLGVALRFNGTHRDSSGN